MQFPHPGPAAAPAVGVPLYAPTPLLQPAHPTPFYIDDILGRGPAAPTPTPTLPSPNSSFTSLVSSYRTPVYEPTPVHPAFSHHPAAALAAAYGSGGFGGPLYSFPRTVNDYTHALLRHDPLGKAAGVCGGPSAGVRGEGAPGGWQRAGGGGRGRETQEKVAATALSERLAGARGNRRRGAPRRRRCRTELGRSAAAAATLIAFPCTLQTSGRAQWGERGLGRPGS